MTQIPEFDPVKEFVPANWKHAYRIRRLLCRLLFRRHEKFSDGNGYLACVRCYQALDANSNSLGYRTHYPDGTPVG
jgi:hypothetical protein